MTKEEFEKCEVLTLILYRELAHIEFDKASGGKVGNRLGILKAKTLNLLSGAYDSVVLPTIVERERLLRSDVISIWKCIDLRTGDVSFLFGDD